MFVEIGFYIANFWIVSVPQYYIAQQLMNQFQALLLQLKTDCFCNVNVPKQEIVEYYCFHFFLNDAANLATKTNIKY